jgi:hypothetical protein
MVSTKALSFPNLHTPYFLDQIKYINVSSLLSCGDWSVFYAYSYYIFLPALVNPPRLFFSLSLSCYAAKHDLSPYPRLQDAVIVQLAKLHRRGDVSSDKMAPVLAYCLTLLRFSETPLLRSLVRQGLLDEQLSVQVMCDRVASISHFCVFC